MIRTNKPSCYISIKTIYRQVFNKEFSTDKIINLDGEIWKEIDETDGKYFVSNKGRIKSYCGHTARILKNEILHGYSYVCICGKKERVHRLVASAFIYNDKPKEKNTVHHIDGNTQNNNSNNL